MFEIQGNDSRQGNSSSIVSRDQEIGNNSFSKTIAFNASVLNGMSHELRTQMNSIVSFAFLLRNSSVNETEKEEFINQIYNTCEQVIMLFENYLESALAETGNQNTDSTSCNLNIFLDSILSEYREKLNRIGGNSIELVSETQFTGNYEVNIDKYRVTRILKCLFQNSFQNTNSGYIKIGYYTSNNELTFYVLDSGQGFSKTREYLHTNDLADTLSQFQDLSSLINISLAKRLIIQLQGSYSVKCNGTSGTGFYFTLPVKIPAKQNNPVNKYVNSMISF
jgi:K+-sensing histidine kinase KdpD